MEIMEINGEKFRCQHRGGNTYSVYKDVGDDYLHDAIVTIKGKYSKKAVYDAYQHQLMLRDAEATTKEYEVQI
jgi:hypothetical protein